MKHPVYATKFWYINLEYVPLQEAKLIHKVSEPSELVLDDLHIAIDDDISV
jgi:hypothetical protein